jgi:polyhydroxyalkanoate synthase
MTDQTRDQTGDTGDEGPPTPLDVWQAWMRAATTTAQPPGTGDPLGGLVEGMIGSLAKDPLTGNVAQLWQANPLQKVIPLDWAKVSDALRTVWLRAMADPERATRMAGDAAQRMTQAGLDVWSAALARWSGQPAPEQPNLVTPGKGDKRFAAPEWQANPVYQGLQQLYLVASEYLVEQAAAGAAEQAAAEPDPEADREQVAEQRRTEFYVRQFVEAMSPTNFLLGNPAAMHKAIETGGASLAEGARNLLADLEAGRLSMTDLEAFAPGRNLAMTPGKVVLRNQLVELIQYEPQTERVHQVPLLFVPPWINKYYVLDLQQHNSLIRHLVDQGFTVFVISWKNPTPDMEEIGFEDYLTLGPLAAAEAAKEITGSATVNPIGYCIGGTLLSMTLAYAAATRDKSFGPATFIVTLLDFAHVGDTAVFIDEPQVEFMEQQMLERGYLDKREMSNMFNLLRATDLIWSNVINSYLMGNKPAAFDLLYWNADGTHMASAAHSFYIRNTYLENNLVEPGKVRLAGQPINLGRIRQDIYAVGTERDHIVPWTSAWRIGQLTKGKTRFVLANSGHIAGVINPPAKGRGTFWTNDKASDTPEEWKAGAERHDGSWWSDWVAWLAERAGEQVPARQVGSERHPPLADAPGGYVLEQ